MSKGTKVLFDFCPFDTQKIRSRPRRTWPSVQAGDAGRGASSSEVRTRYARSDTREGRGVTPREGWGAGGGPKKVSAPLWGTNGRDKGNTAAESHVNNKFRIFFKAPDRLITPAPLRPGASVSVELKVSNETDL